MFLGRMANGVYWMHRYIERAENMVRLLDAGLYMSLTKFSSASEEWSSVVRSAGVASEFLQKYDTYDVQQVSTFFLKDKDNLSSVINCIDAARRNAREVRTMLTRELWESVNEAWMEINRCLKRKDLDRDLGALIDNIKQYAAQITGFQHSTMLRNEIYNFARLGTFIERADNTARILDVKYYLLLPAVNLVGSAQDVHQWESILRSVSAYSSYRWVYGVDYRPAQIMDYMILDERMPRSLRYCMNKIYENILHLAGNGSPQESCHQTAERQLNILREATIDMIFDTGLHEFLQAFQQRNAQLSDEIASTYNFY